MKKKITIFCLLLLILNSTPCYSDEDPIKTLGSHLNSIQFNRLILDVRPYLENLSPEEMPSSLDSLVNKLVIMLGNERKTSRNSIQYKNILNELISINNFSFSENKPFIDQGNNNSILESLVQGLDLDSLNMISEEISPQKMILFIDLLKSINRYLLLYADSLDQKTLRRFVRVSIFFKENWGIDLLSEGLLDVYISSFGTDVFLLERVYNITQGPNKDKKKGWITARMFGKSIVRIELIKDLISSTSLYIWQLEDAQQEQYFREDGINEALEILIKKYISVQSGDSVSQHISTLKMLRDIWHFTGVKEASEKSVLKLFISFYDNLDEVKKKAMAAKFFSYLVSLSPGSFDKYSHMLKQFDHIIEIPYGDRAMVVFALKYSYHVLDKSIDLKAMGISDDLRLAASKVENPFETSVRFHLQNEFPDLIPYIEYNYFLGETSKYVGIIINFKNGVPLVLNFSGKKHYAPLKVHELSLKASMHDDLLIALGYEVKRINITKYDLQNPNDIRLLNGDITNIITGFYRKIDEWADGAYNPVDSLCSRSIN